MTNSLGRQTDNKLISRLRGAGSPTIRWSAVGVIFAVGTALTIASIILSITYDWQGIWPQVMLAWGTTIALSGILFGIQEAFVRKVNRHVEQQVNQAAANLEDRIGKRITRLEDVAGETDAVRNARYASEDQVITDLREDTSYQSVANALGQAAAFKAISNGDRQGRNSFRVRAGSPLDSLRLSLKRKYDPAGTSSDSLAPYRVLVWSPWKADISVDVDWDAGMTVAVMFDSLRQQFNEKRLNVGEKEFDVDFTVKELVRSLDVSIKSRRGQDFRRLQAPIVEVVDDQWAFTEAGLESLKYEYLLPDLVFPRLRGAVMGQTRKHISAQKLRTVSMRHTGTCS
jgi:hypothetical protein